MHTTYYWLPAFLLVGLLTACQDPAPTTGETTTYPVIFRDSEAGAYTKQSTAPGEYLYTFHFTDRGRGPDYRETIALDEAGFIREQTILGVNYLKDSIDEQFSVQGATATLLNPLGAQERAFPGGQLYFRFDGSPAIYEVLANLLTQAEEQTVALFPEGEAELIQTFPQTIDGQDLSVLMINGLETDPVYIWMDGDEMAARLDGNLHVVRQDLLPARQELKAIQDSLENEFLATQARDLAHDYTRALIQNVSVFTPDGQLLADRDVLVDGPVITSILPAGTGTAGADILTLDGSGKTLLPGLFDMHTHNSKFRGALHLAGGVTSVRDLANNKQLVELRTQFDEHSILGPRIVYMCGIIDGPGPYANQRNAIDNLEEGLAEIQAYKDLGYQQIKIYSSIKPEWLADLAARSHELGMKVSGHIPAFMTASQAIEQGFDEIQHINMLFLNFQSDTLDTRTPLRFTMVAQHGGDLNLDSPEYRDFVQQLKTEDIIVDPTVAIFENMFMADKGEPSPTYAMVMDRFPVLSQRDFLSGGLPKSAADTPTYEAAFAKMLAVIYDLHQNGIRLVAGTDGLPGFLYHRELELYHQSGIPAAEVLQMATIHAARIAGVAETLGSIEPGKQADLILVDGNPLENISDIRRVEWVLKGGKLFYPEEIYGSMGIAHFQ